MLSRMLADANVSQGRGLLLPLCYHLWRVSNILNIKTKAKLFKLVVDTFRIKRCGHAFD